MAQQIDEENLHRQQLNLSQHQPRHPYVYNLEIKYHVIVRGCNVDSVRFRYIMAVKLGPSFQKLP